MAEELIALIKNAVARGNTIQQAAQSLLNAGYSSSEVNEAVNSLTRGAIPIAEFPGKSMLKPGAQSQSPQPQSLKTQPAKPEVRKILQEPQTLQPQLQGSQFNNPISAKIEDESKKYDGFPVQQEENKPVNIRPAETFEQKENKKRKIKIALVIVVMLLIVLSLIAALVLKKEIIIDWLTKQFSST